MQLTNKRLTESELARYFDIFTKMFLRDPTPELVDVELLDPALGDQYEARGARLHGITYDADSRELDVIFEGGEHHAFVPAEVLVAEEPDGFIAAMEIIRGDGTKELVRLTRKPLPSLSPKSSDRSG